MSPFISTSLAPYTTCSSLDMPSFDHPPFAPKGQAMMKPITTTFLLVFLSIVLFASSCEARVLRGHGKGSSSKPGKDVASVRADGWPTRQAEAEKSTVHTARDDLMARADAKQVKEGAPTMAAAPPPGFRVSQRLSQREDTGFHLDYAGPRTHTPSHN